MASDRTMAKKAEQQRLRGQLVQQGDTFAELQGQGITSARRANRLKADKVGLTRKQRKELARLREQRRWWRREPAVPKWAKPKPDELATDEQIKVIADDVRGLFERGMVLPVDGATYMQVDDTAGDVPLSEAEKLNVAMFSDWHTRHLVRDVPITRKQLDAALGEIMNRLKQDVTDDGVKHG